MTETECLSYHLRNKVWQRRDVKEHCPKAKVPFALLHCLNGTYGLIAQNADETTLKRCCYPSMTLAVQKGALVDCSYPCGFRLLLIRVIGRRCVPEALVQPKIVT